MSTVLSPPVPVARPLPTVPELPVWRFTVAEYHELLRTGILHDGEPVELLEGVLVPKMTKGRRHVIASTRTRQALERLLPAGWHVEVQDPVTTADSEPEPDLAVVRGQPEDYDEHPGTADTPLLIEVSESTLARDRGVKLRIYARAGVAEYWTVNLAGNVLEVYTQPSGPTDAPKFGQRTEYALDQAVPLRLEELTIGEILVAELFPRDGR